MTEFDPVEFGRSIGAMIREAVEPLKSENAELRKEIEALKALDPDRTEAQAVEIDVSDVVKELLASDGIKQLVGLEVVDLHRIRIGPLSLGDLPEGRWRHLTPSEREALIVSARP